MGVFSLHTAVREDRLAVQVSGECDLSTSDRLGEALLAAVAASPRVEVDLTGVEFLDSSGIHALVVAYQETQKAGGLLWVTGATGVVATVLDLTGVAQLLSCPPAESAEP